MVLCLPGAQYAVLEDWFWKIDLGILLLFHIVSLRLSYTISKIMMFSWKPKITSWWYIRYGALYAVSCDGFWKADYVCSIEIVRLSYTVSEIMRFSCKPKMTWLVYIRQGAPCTVHNDGVWKGIYGFPLVFYSNFTSIMYLSEIMMFSCKPEMTSWWFLRYGEPYEVFDDGFWKGDHNFIFMLCWHILSIFNRLRVIRPFHFGWDFLTAGQICGVFGEIIFMVVCYRDRYLIGIQTEIACEKIWTYTRIIGPLYPEFQISAWWSGYEGMDWLIQLMFS